ncbi:hypothetical protein LBMAG56_16170 [Verrucomicrobiota bacterium]|nr:hypothetical protein LBMAG56_16170 [Verrucomicrobiota bacterium]
MVTNSSHTLFLVRSAFAADRDLFDYDGQKNAGKEVKKIIFIGDAGTHGGRGNHEFMAGEILLARALHAAYPGVHCVLYSTKHWPKDVGHADAIIVALNHGQRAATDPNIAAAIKRGAGFGALHFGVEVNKGEAGNNYLSWMGGYFETFYSVNPWWTPKYHQFPDHPVARGVKPFSVRDEWYYHMRFVPDEKGVTPILSDLPPLNTAGKNRSDRGGNEFVHADVAAGKPQHMAWVYERPDGGRGFGFTGLHVHANLGNDSFRTVLLNGVAWVAKLEIPKDGVPSTPVDTKALEQVIDDARAALAAGK